MSAIILDLDNCIANDGWRIPMIDWQHKDPMRRYHRYHCLAAFDEVGNQHLFRETEHDIIIFTARPTLYRPITEEWLRRNNVFWKCLVMRNDNDHRPSVELKRTQLRWLPDLYGVDFQDIAAAHDDREDVVAMYKEHGIPSFVSAIHNTCAYTKPKETV
jgi:hypothetical protein